MLDTNSSNQKADPVNKKFVEWLQEWKSEADQRGSRTFATCFARAANNLSKEKTPMNVYDLKKVSGIGPNIVKRLAKKTEEFLKQGGTSKLLYAEGCSGTSKLAVFICF